MPLLALSQSLARRPRSLLRRSRSRCGHVSLGHSLRGPEAARPSQPTSSSWCSPCLHFRLRPLRPTVQARSEGCRATRRAGPAPSAGPSRGRGRSAARSRVQCGLAPSTACPCACVRAQTRSMTARVPEPSAVRRSPSPPDLDGLGDPQKGVIGASGCCLAVAGLLHSLVAVGERRQLGQRTRETRGGVSPKFPPRN